MNANKLGVIEKEVIKEKMKDEMLHNMQSRILF